MSSSSKHIPSSPIVSTQPSLSSPPQSPIVKRRRIEHPTSSSSTSSSLQHRASLSTSCVCRNRQVNCHTDQGGEYNKCNTLSDMHTHRPRQNSTASTARPSSHFHRRPPMSPSTSLRAAIRKVQHTPHLADQEKQKRIHQLFVQLREKNIKKHIPDHGTFPGKGAERGCAHYERKCWLKAKCCGRFYACRRCHDEQEDHEIDRHATEQIACTECGKIQPVADKCIDCDVKFARYFCNICKFYDDTEGKEAYHCDKCGICRVGKGLGIDNYHCDGCNTCVPLSAQGDHPCRDRSLDANCPICTEYLQTSTDPVVFMRCGHTMHTKCLEKHTRTAYTCPLCHKCLTDMTDYYRELDKKIATEVIQPEYRNRKSHIMCYDCDHKTTVRFHLVFHKCGNHQCGGYNTRVLASFDEEPTEEEEDALRTLDVVHDPSNNNFASPNQQVIEVTIDGDTTPENG